MSKVERLIIACEDMTEVLILDPKIEVSGKSQMRLDLVEAAKLLKTADMSKLKEETVAVLEKLGVELPKREKKEGKGEKKEGKGESKKGKGESKKGKGESKKGKGESKKDCFLESLKKAPKTMFEIKKEKWNINTKKFHSMLRKVSLGGLITDCFLQIEGLNWKMSALDPTSTIFIQSEEKINDDKPCNEILNFREIGKLCKFIGDIKEKEENIEVEIKDNRLCLFTKTKGNVKFLLGGVEKKDQDKSQKGIEKVLEVVKNKKELNSKKIDELLYFINLFCCEELKFRIKNGKISVGSPDDSIQIFSVAMGKEDREDLELRFNAQIFKAVMAEIEWESKEVPVMLYEKESPIVFQQGKSIWILALIV